MNKSIKSDSSRKTRLIIAIAIILIGSSTWCWIKNNPGRKSAENAMSQIGAIYNAYKMFECDRDTTTITVSELEEFGYLAIDTTAKREWKFSVNWPDLIDAISTDEMPGGAGKIIKYDILQGTFHGYKLPKEGYNFAP
ncbi:MAG: hypothetical protein P9L92_17215 [Candidatus Electryonea clarkiae]|nr:hypothetical protein [Candidatus Electryonea clarkiae]MDP8288231.1 hypothetical protein [Candidatus Electryonea clarkiae]